MANPTLFNTQAASLPAANTVNAAGGRAFALEPRHALAQNVVTGCLNGTFYAPAEEHLKTVIRLCESVSPEFIARAAIFGREQGYMKDMPALLLAVLSRRSPELLQRVFPRVCNDAKMVRNFVQIMRSGAVGRRSLGSLPKRLVRNWFAERTAEQIVRASVGTSPSLADLIRMVHPTPESPERAALYRWLLGKPQEANATPELVRQLEAFHCGESVELPDVPFQLLTAQPLTEAQWCTIARRASWQTLRMNLNTFARHGVFHHAGLTREIAVRLRERTEIRRSRVFPYQLMNAYKQVGGEVPGSVKDALQDAMEVSVENVPSFDGRIVVCPDVSGSMQSPITGRRRGATSAVRCIDVAALVAACVLRKNPRTTVIPFSDTTIAANLNPRDSIMTNANTLAALPSGGTNCSAPLAQLNAQRAQVDLVIVVSDNMSWVDSQGGGRSTATMAEWSVLRSRNRNARLVCLDLQPGTTTQAAEWADILNVGGFSDAVFEIIAAFARGELEPGHWVGRIESIVI